MGDIDSNGSDIEKIIADLLSEHSPLTADDVQKAGENLNHVDSADYAGQLLSHIACQKLDEEIYFEDDPNRKNRVVHTLSGIIVNAISALEKQATTDHMTGIPNRMKFDNEKPKPGEKFGVIMFDIDHFKEFNDNYGHEFGDLALQTVADLLKKTVRRVARYGGEEFSALLRNGDAEYIENIAERARSAVERYGMSKLYAKCENALKQMDQQNGRIKTFRETYEKLKKDSPGLRISAGAARNEIGDDVDAVKNKADAALYNSKGGGRNVVTMYVEGMKHPESH